MLDHNIAMHVWWKLDAVIGCADCQLVEASSHGSLQDISLHVRMLFTGVFIPTHKAGVFVPQAVGIVIKRHPLQLDTHRCLCKWDNGPVSDVQGASDFTSGDFDATHALAMLKRLLLHGLQRPLGPEMESAPMVEVLQVSGQENMIPWLLSTAVSMCKVCSLLYGQVPCVSHINVIWAYSYGSKRHC